MGALEESEAGLINQYAVRPEVVDPPPEGDTEQKKTEPQPKKHTFRK